MKYFLIIALLLGGTLSSQAQVAKPGIISRTWTTLTKPFAGGPPGPQYPTPRKVKKFKPQKPIPVTYHPQD